LSVRNGSGRGTTRRGLVRTATGLAAAVGTSLGIGGVPEALVETKSTTGSADDGRDRIEPFWGPHQGGITTPVQSHTYAAALDLITTKRDDVIKLLRIWTTAAAKMSSGQPAQPLGRDVAQPPPDSGEALGLPTARLTVTFGFGAGLFVKGGRDRYGLAAQRPPALVDLPRFNGDQLIETHSGGDLSVQACADDPQVTFHAVRQLARLAYGSAEVRWAQTGFIPSVDAKQTPRNLMGFKDGTSNLSINDPAALEKFVWVGSEGPDWMHGGTYVVLRRIRIALEHWDRMPLDFQEKTFGRHKYSGAPLGLRSEFDPLDLNSSNKDGSPVIPESAHVRLAAAASNAGAQILRRPYSYNDGVNFTTERWPPWRQGMEYDAGLFFVCYQRDPRTGFIKIFDKLSKYDMLNQFVTHTGGGLFACPGGIAQGEFVGQHLLETSRPRGPG
jgi:deferrochelatase/peroxidase EfeB